MKTYKQPSTVGRFGEFGGMYVSETLMPLLLNLDKSYKKIQKDKKFKKELNDLFKNYVGRPSSLHYAKNLSKYINGPKVYFKRDELNHTGAHKINNCLGQILLAKKDNTWACAERLRMHNSRFFTICSEVSILSLSAHDAFAICI